MSPCPPCPSLGHPSPPLGVPGVPFWSPPGPHRAPRRRSPAPGGTSGLAKSQRLSSELGLLGNLLLLLLFLIVPLHQPLIFPSQAAGAVKAVPPLSRLQPPGASPAAAAGQYFGHLCPLPGFSRSCPLGGGPGMSPGTATPAARVALAGYGAAGGHRGGRWHPQGGCGGAGTELGRFRVVLG